MENKEHILDLIRRRAELKTKLGVLSWNLFHINQEISATVQAIMAVNDEIREAEQRELITDIVTIGDLDVGS